MNPAPLKVRLRVFGGQIALGLGLGIIVLLSANFSSVANATSATYTHGVVGTPVPVALSSYAAVDPHARYKIRDDVPTIETVPPFPRVEPPTTATDPATPVPSATATSSATPTPSPTPTDETP